MVADTVMLDPNGMEAPNAEENHRNGFIDPRNLNNQLEDMDITNDANGDEYDSSDLEDQHDSDYSEPEVGPVPRKAWLPSGLCYDDRMRLHAIADWSDNEGHPESPQRIESIFKEFKDAGLIFKGTDDELEMVLKTSPTAWMWRIQAREATKDEITIVHGASHFKWVEALSWKTPQELRDLTNEMDKGRKSLYVGSLTYEASVISAGGAIEVCKNVVVGTVKNAIAVIRPPGHHAEQDTAMGFCLFNNVSIAARVCQTDYPKLCRKILILDWDVHHGNGIQNIFYRDPNILYISLHVYKNGSFYPDPPEEDSTPDGGPSNVGSGAGMGRNVNIGWHDQGMGDGEYIAAFQRIVMPIAQEFDPDLVIVSAGFDAAEGDELGGCHVTPSCYSHMTHMLMSLANGKVAVCLEGGYNLRAISRSALAVAKTLMGEPPPRMDKIPPICKQATIVLDEVREYQAPYWDCMRTNLAVVRAARDLGGAKRNEVVRMNYVVRGFQKRILYETNSMISLYVQKDKLSKSFQDQILVTKGLGSAKKILMIIHDPPEIVASPDPMDNTVEAHNAWMTDGAMPYINWATANDFGVIDVNVPMNIATSKSSRPDSLAYASRPSEEALGAQLKELVTYLWDNYLEGYSSNEIVLMGVGDSYLAVKLLLTNRDCTHKISSVVNFVNGSLRPVKSDTNTALSVWYKTHSLVFCAADHLCWSDPTLERKVAKNRFGNVIKSTVTGLVRMMLHHKQEVWDFLGRNNVK